jgi:hypothetical protein
MNVTPGNPGLASTNATRVSGGQGRCANTGIAMTNIMAAMTSATVTNTRMRLIMRNPLPRRARLVGPAALRNRVSMNRNKVWRNFRELRKGEVRRTWPCPGPDGLSLRGPIILPGGITRFLCTAFMLGVPSVYKKTRRIGPGPTPARRCFASYRHNLTRLKGGNRHRYRGGPKKKRRPRARCARLFLARRRPTTTPTGYERRAAPRTRLGKHCR